MTARRFIDIERLVETLGLQLLSREISGNCHIKLRVRSHDQREETFFMAMSPGDRRSRQNVTSILRRFARGQTTKTERKST